MNDFKPKYERKTCGPTKISKSAIAKAMRSLISGTKTYKHVAERTNISISTLKRHKRKWLSLEKKPDIPKMHMKRVLTDAEESSLVQFLCELKTLGIKVRVVDVCKLVYKFGQKRKLQEEIGKWKKDQASMDWFRGFVSRNPKAVPSIWLARKVTKTFVRSPSGKQQFSDELKFRSLPIVVSVSYLYFF